MRLQEFVENYVEPCVPRSFNESCRQWEKPDEWLKMGNLTRFVIYQYHFSGSITNGSEK